MRLSRNQMTILATVVFASILIIAGVDRGLANQGPEVAITDSGTRADQPDVAVDASGHVHIVYCDEVGTNAREIWYTMLTGDGNTLIEDTMLTVDDGDDSTRPAIVIDTDDGVHILWQDRRWDGGTSQEVTYMKLDPALDDQDGSPADPGTIIAVGVTRLSDNGNWKIYGIRTVIDSGGGLHIVWDDDDVEAIFYMKVDNNGVETVAETMLREAIQWRALPDIAVDSMDNLHVTWADYDETDADEIYYMMLDSGGAVRIDATLLTDDDGNHSKWTAIVVDHEDKVHIVFQDQRGQHHEIYHTRIDPALDDQNGNAADGAAITLIDDHALTPDDGWKSRHSAVAARDGRFIHITWDESGLGPDVGFMMLDAGGDEVVAGTTLTTTGTADASTDWTIPYLDVDADGQAHVVWCDARSGAYEIYYTTFRVGGNQGDGCDGCGCALFESERIIDPGQLAAFGLLALAPFAFVMILRRRRNRS